MNHTLTTLLELAATYEGREQIRVMVAGLVGWQGVFRSKYGDLWGIPPGGNHFDALPHWPTDLNACAELRRELATCKQSLQVATDETADLRRQLEEANSLLRNLTDERSAILSYLRESGFTPCGEVGPLQCLKAFINKSREDTARLDKLERLESRNGEGPGWEIANDYGPNWDMWGIYNGSEAGYKAGYVAPTLREAIDRIPDATLNQREE